MPSPPLKYYIWDLLFYREKRIILEEKLIHVALECLHAKVRILKIGSIQTKYFLQIFIPLELEYSPYVPQEYVI